MLITQFPKGQDTPQPPAKVRGTAVDMIFNLIEDGIMSGRYVTGQRLIETELARDFSTSRGPIREAFRKLAAEGLVESIPHRGVIVRRLSRKEIREFFQIRTALESLAVTLTTANVIVPKVREAFERAIEPIWSDAPRLAGRLYFDENRIFHDAIATFSGNQQLATVCHQMKLPLTVLQLSSILTPDILALSNREHRNIANLMLAGDSKGAVRAMQNHITRGQLLTDSLPDHLFRITD